MGIRTTIIVLAWLVSFGVALFLDRPVAQTVRDRGWDQKKTWKRDTHRLAETLKVPGEYTATAVAAAAVGFFNRRRWRAAGIVALAGALSGLNGALKWIIGRRRPVAGIDPFNLDFFVGGWNGLMGAEKNLCFPSGHACLAFANAAALALLIPRWRWAFYAVAAVVAVERIVENAHYVSDTVAGAGLGILCAHLAFCLVKRFAPDRGTGVSPVLNAGRENDVRSSDGSIATSEEATTGSTSRR